MKIIIERITYIILVVLSIYLGVFFIKWNYLYSGIFLICVPTLTIIYAFIIDFKNKEFLPTIFALYMAIAFFLFCWFDAWNSFYIEEIDNVPEKREFYIPKPWDRLYPEWWFKELAILKDDFEGVKYDSQENLNVEDNTFQIYKWFQGWIYSYEAWLNIPAPWKIYLKAYDALTNTELSSDRLKDASVINVMDTGGKFHLFSLLDKRDRRFFTIYEWDWWEYYGAKFELWYSPTGSWSQQLQKLAEDFYIIDGWER